MASLSYPNHPSHLSFLTPHEPMRMTLSDDPVVAMMVQKNAKAGQRGDGTGLFLVIKKDGSMISLSCTEAYGQGLRFIDYLTEDESFTVTGSSSGDPKDDPREAVVDEKSPLFDFGIEVGECDYRNAPLYVPFFAGSECVKLCMIAERRYDGGRVIIQGGRLLDNGVLRIEDGGYDTVNRGNSGQMSGYGPRSYADRVYRFVKVADLSDREIFKTNATAQEVCDIATWPF